MFNTTITANSFSLNSEKCSLGARRCYSHYHSTITSRLLPPRGTRYYHLATWLHFSERNENKFSVMVVKKLVRLAFGVDINFTKSLGLSPYREPTITLSPSSANECWMCCGNRFFSMAWAACVPCTNWLPRIWTSSFSRTNSFLCEKEMFLFIVTWYLLKEASMEPLYSRAADSCRRPIIGRFGNQICT